MEKSFHFFDEFLRQVSLSPQQLAIDAGEVQLSYQELLLMVLNIEQKIIAHSPSAIIAIQADSSPNMIASMLAVWKQNKTIVPVHPQWPEQRKLELLKKTGAQLYIEIEEGTVCLRELSWTAPGKQSFFAETPAYILYTSGSTGAPKGVPVPYSALQHFLQFFVKGDYDFNHSDRFLQVYEPVFDVFYFSLLVPLCCGSTCVLLPQNKLPRYLSILKTLRDQKITVVSMVPSILLMALPFLKDFELPHIRYSFFSGDALTLPAAEAWNRVCKNGVLHNCYGPTETTIVCTRYIWQEDWAKQESLHQIVPLGEPFPEMDFLLIDEQLEPVPAGHIGELAFSGPQVIPAYLHQESPEKFFTFYAGEGKEKRYYRTGDLVSVNGRGQLLFHGRNDFQLKINGFRIDPAEIEAAIQGELSTPAIVLGIPNTQQLLELHAFLLKKEELPILGEFPKDLLQQLQLKIPEYMVPQHFHWVDSFPLSSNGKIDRKALMEESKKKFKK